jgi:hypothetical protein
MLMVSYIYKTPKPLQEDVSDDRISGQIFLQQAETVRLISPCDDGTGNSTGWVTLPVTQVYIYSLYLYVYITHTPFKP